MRNMRMIFALTFLVLSLFFTGHALSSEGSVAKGFVPPREKIEKPYTNDKCLTNCHGEKGFGASAPTGELRSIFVDVKGFIRSVHGAVGIGCIDCHPNTDPNFHPREGYPDVDCRACHSKSKPDEAHPKGMLEKLVMRGVKPPPAESLKGEGWQQTAHGKGWLGNAGKGAFCSDCHSAHGILRSSDPASTVHPDNLPATCGRCHQGKSGGSDIGGMLAGFRLAGHGKGDLSEDYSVTQCRSCHQGEAAHNEESLTGQTCSECHRPKGVEKGSFHLSPNESGTVTYALRWLYNLGVGGSVLGVTLIALFWGFSVTFKKREEEE